MLNKIGVLFYLYMFDLYMFDVYIYYMLIYFCFIDLWCNVFLIFSYLILC